MEYFEEISLGSLHNINSIVVTLSFISFHIFLTNSESSESCENFIKPCNLYANMFGNSVVMHYNTYTGTLTHSVS